MGRKTENITRIVLTTIALTVALSYRPAHAGDGQTVEADLSGRKGETIFFLLGMLDEYTCRYQIEGEDRIESFSFSGGVNAYVFLAYLHRLSREQGLDSDVEFRVRDKGHIDLYSRPLSQFINSFYEFVPTAGKTIIDGEERNQFRACLSYEPFEGRDRTLKLAFIAGAKFIYGRDGSIHYANSSARAMLIARLLDELGCKNIEVNSKPGLPAQNSVIFEPSEELLDWFARYPGDWAFTAADSLMGFPDVDETAVYQAVLATAQNGAFEGCALRSRFVVPRVSGIDWAGPAALPGQSESVNEAIEDYNRIRMDMVSLIGLASNQVEITNGPYRSDDLCAVNLMRVGFDRNRVTAAVFLHYMCPVDDLFCSRGVAAFLKKQDDGTWVVTHYALRNKRG